MKKPSKRIRSLLIIAAVLLVGAVTTAAALELNSPKSYDGALPPEGSYSERMSVRGPNCTHGEDYTEPVAKVGRYYLGGDTNSYYLEILPGNKIQLGGISPQELFSTWYSDPSEPTAAATIAELSAEWSGEREFEIITAHAADDSVIIAVYKEFDDNGELRLVTGPTLADENTISDWGIAGDFIFVE